MENLQWKGGDEMRKTACEGTVQRCMLHLIWHHFQLQYLGLGAQNNIIKQPMNHD